MESLLTTPTFDNIRRYIEQEVNYRYTKVLTRFFYNLNKILTPVYRERLANFVQDLQNVQDMQDLHDINNSFNCNDNDDYICYDDTLNDSKNKNKNDNKVTLVKLFYLPISVILDRHTNTYIWKKSEDNPSTRCIARTVNDTQCLRDYSDKEKKLCGLHLNENPYGIFGEDNPREIDKNIKKQLQKSHKIVKTLRGLRLSDYIKTTEIELNNKVYLLDENNFLYEQLTFNILAQIKDYKVYWFNTQ